MNKDEAIAKLKMGKRFSHEDFDLWRDDFGVALIGVIESHNSFNYITDKLKHDPTFIYCAMKHNPRIIMHIPEELISDLKIAEAIVKANGMALGLLSSELQNNSKIVLAAVKNNEIAFMYASERIHEICKGRNTIEALIEDIED